MTHSIVFATVHLSSLGVRALAELRVSVAVQPSIPQIWPPLTRKRPPRGSRWPRQTNARHFFRPLPLALVLLPSLSPMPRSEIDDIFAGKAKAPAPPVASTSDAAEKKKKKSAKKRKREAEGKITADDPKSAEQPNKRRVPETVVDPSLAIAAPAAKRSKTSKADRPPEVKKKSKASKEDEERFKDSRGTGPSMSLTTVNVLICPCNAFRRRAHHGGGLFRVQRGRAWYHRPGRRYVLRSRHLHASHLPARHTSLSFRLPVL